MGNTKIINKFGTMTGWNSVTANFLGRDAEGISKLSYDDTEALENVYGAGKYPIGRSSGNYEAKCSMTLYKEEIDALKLALPKGKRLQDVASFDIVVVYAKSDGSITKDIIHNVQFTSDGVDISQGDGTVQTEYPMIVSHITWNAA